MRLSCVIPTKRAVHAAIAIASLGVFAESRQPSRSGTPLLRFESAWYDGMKVSGRILVGATGGTVLVPAWAMEGYDFSVEKVSECYSRKPLKYLVTDIVGNLPRTPPIEISPGYWYGKDVMYPLFVEGGPPCIELTLGFLLGGRPPAVEVRITIKKTDGPRSK